MNTDSLCLQPELKVGSLGEDVVSAFQILQRLSPEKSVALRMALETEQRLSPGHHQKAEF